MSKSLVAVVISVAAPLASGQPLRDYRCVVERVATANEPSGSQLEQLQKRYIGKEFTVERRTGLMVGALKNAYITKPQVVDLGSEDNSFKVVTVLRKEEGAGRGSNVYTLVINEYARSSKKVFVFLENDEAYFGTCIHF